MEPPPLFGDFYSCSKFPVCKSSCKAIDGLPDLASFRKHKIPALLTLNDYDVHRVLMKIARTSYPTNTIPEFTIKIHSKDSSSIHGNWSYPKSNKISHINIYNLYRKYEHTLSTTIHELAHHCHYMIAGETNHKREFYEVFKHLLEIAHNLGFINLVETYDMIDNADRKQLEKHFGLPEILTNDKAEFDLIKIDCEREYPQLKERGYIYSVKEQKWICSLHQVNALSEINWIEVNCPGIEYEIINNKINTVDTIYFCILGNFHAIHHDKLIANGFYYDEVNGWVKRFKANAKLKMDELCSLLKIKPLYKGFTPKVNKLADAYKLVPKLGKTTDGICPGCGSKLIVKSGNFGRFKACSKFLLGCNYVERSINARK